MPMPVPMPMPMRMPVPVPRPPSRRAPVRPAAATAPVQSPWQTLLAVLSRKGATGQLA